MLFKPHCRGLTLVCLNCDFLAGATGSDLMSKHLVDRPTHVCQVILEQSSQPEEHHGMRHVLEKQEQNTVIKMKVYNQTKILTEFRTKTAFFPLL